MLERVVGSLLPTMERVTRAEEKIAKKGKPFPYVAIKFYQKLHLHHYICGGKGGVLTFVFQVKSGILILIQRSKSASLISLAE